jgi:prephenate dehydratase
MKVGFLGPVGTYSHKAASLLHYNQLTPFVSLESLILEGLEEMDIVVPWENTSIGLIDSTIDTLLQCRHQTLNQLQTITIKIKHALFLRKRSDFKSVKYVWSHSAALHQCSRYLQRYTVRSCHSTLDAFDRAGLDDAVIASDETVKEGWEMVDDDIMDERYNHTVFWVLSKHVERECSSAWIFTAEKNMLQYALDVRTRIQRPSLASKLGIAHDQAPQYIYIILLGVTSTTNCLLRIFNRP